MAAAMVGARRAPSSNCAANPSASPRASATSLSAIRAAPRRSRRALCARPGAVGVGSRSRSLGDPVVPVGSSDRQNRPGPEAVFEVGQTPLPERRGESRHEAVVLGVAVVLQRAERVLGQPLGVGPRRGRDLAEVRQARHGTARPPARRCRRSARARGPRAPGSATSGRALRRGPREPRPPRSPGGARRGPRSRAAYGTNPRTPRARAACPSLRRTARATSPAPCARGQLEPQAPLRRSVALAQLHQQLGPGARRRAPRGSPRSGSSSRPRRHSL